MECWFTMWEMYSEGIILMESFIESPMLFQKIIKVREATDVYMASRILGTFGRLMYKNHHWIIFIKFISVLRLEIQCRQEGKKIKLFLKERKNITSALMQ